MTTAAPGGDELRTALEALANELMVDLDLAEQVLVDRQRRAPRPDAIPFLRLEDVAGDVEDARTMADVRRALDWLVAQAEPVARLWVAPVSERPS